METTAGVIITDGTRFLVAHPTGGPWRRSWSIPKGIIDKSETPKEAAIREVKEETGISLDSSKLLDKGIYPYRVLKNLHIFVYNIDSLNVASLRCVSVFEQKPGVYAPEVDKYAWIPYIKAAEYLNPNLYKIFSEVMK